MKGSILQTPSPIMAMNIIKMQAAGGNAIFVSNYNEYTVAKWQAEYFKYDLLHSLFKSFKGMDVININSASLVALESELAAEIRRVEAFLRRQLDKSKDELSQLLQKYEDFTLNLTDDSVKSSKKSSKNPASASLERLIRVVYDDCQNLRSFYRLNKYAIEKIAMKYELLLLKCQPSTDPLLAPLPPVGSPGDSFFAKKAPSHRSESGKFDDDFQYSEWKAQPSYKVFAERFCIKSEQIMVLEQACVDMYCSVFRKNKYFSVARNDLKYNKNKDRVFNQTRVLFGFKVGIILTCCLWLLGDSITNYDLREDESFWGKNNIYIYTTVGNVLLFELSWCINLWLWEQYNINFYEALGYSRTRNHNVFEVMNSTATMFIPFFTALIIHYEANKQSSIFSDTFLSYSTPFIMIVLFLLYTVYSQVTKRLYKKSKSIGLFSRSMPLRFLMALFIKPKFRDIYAADYLVSFTKIINDFVIGSCVFFSGELFSHAGSESLYCSTKNVKIVASAFSSIPLFIRSCQCLKLLYDTKLVFPHGFNAVKYITGIFVVIWGFYVSSDTKVAYILYIILTTLYKFWWDCVMDWGLFKIWPTQDEWNHFAISLKLFFTEFDLAIFNGRRDPKRRWFLRPKLLYADAIPLYYVAIAVDLVCRFLWVSSLVPLVAEVFPSPKFLSLMLGSIEILRRFMWGHYRIELENVRALDSKSFGYMNRSISYHPIVAGIISDMAIHSEPAEVDKAASDPGDDNIEYDNMDMYGTVKAEEPPDISNHAAHSV